MCISVVESQRAVETYRDPDSVGEPRHLTYLALLTWMNIKRFLQCQILNLINLSIQNNSNAYFYLKIEMISCHERGRGRNEGKEST